MLFEFISDTLRGIYDSVPENYKLLFSLALYTLFIVIYSLFIWKFYKFLASKNILELDLRQYNRSQNPGMEKFIASSLYTIEYIIILPFLVLFWFIVFSLFLLLLSEYTDTMRILLISAAIIASTRITAYLSEDLSRDIAKIFPFTVLALFLLNPNFFEISKVIDKIIQIPALLNNIVYFIIFIFAVELILRAIFSISLLFREDNSN